MNQFGIYNKIMKLKIYFQTTKTKQKDFAYRLKVSPITLSRWLAGTRHPSFKKMVEIQRLTKNKVRLEDWI